MSRRFRATIYDYAGSRTIIVEGAIRRPSSFTITTSSDQPPVADEEFEEAVEVLRAHPEFSKQLAAGEWVVYQPMPPLIDVQEIDGRTRRVIAVGVFSREHKKRQEILGVELPTARLFFPLDRPDDLAQELLTHWS